MSPGGRVARPASSFLEDESAPPSKRRRVALACDSCRDRKIRCDGTKPVCGPCGKRDDGLVDCSYTVLANSAKRVSEQEYIASLRRQIQDLQQAIDKQPEAASRAASSAVSGTEPSIPLSPDTCTTNPLHSPGQPAHHSAVSNGQLCGFDGSPVQLSRQRPGLFGTDAGYRPPPSRRLAPNTVISPRDSSASLRTDHRRPHTQAGHPLSDDATGDLGDLQEPSPISAMGATVSIQDQPSIRRRNEFYGESSLVSLLRDILQPPSRPQDRGSHGESVSSSVPFVGGATGGPRTNAMLQVQFALPPREVADNLLGLYFSGVHIFYPWVHSLTFRAEYDRLWASQLSDTPGAGVLDIGLGGGRCPRHVFFGALNAMFALGCEFSDLPAEEKEAASAMFFDRMRDLLLFDVFDSGSIAHVQALLLVGQYLLCTHYPTQCWNVVGLACRMAIGLGLQLDNGMGELTDLEREVRRRVWYACVQMDMTVSMTLGRPLFLRVAEYDVPLPRAIDDQYLSSDAGGCSAQPEGSYSVAAFTVENIKLAKILVIILERVYQPYAIARRASASSRQDATFTHDDLAVILDIDTMLEEFVPTLAPGLQWDDHTRSNEAVPAILKRQSNVLQARFLHMKVLLHRPSFTSFCALAHAQAPTREQRHTAIPSRSIRQAKETELTMTLRVKCAIVCVNKTCELVESLRRATTEGATGAWWFNLFYLITSAIILILTECTPLLKSDLNQQTLNTAWNDCLETLRLISRTHVLTDRYVKSLETLRQRSINTFKNTQRLFDASNPPAPNQSRPTGTMAGANVLQPSDPAQAADHESLNQDAPSGGLDGFTSNDVNWQYTYAEDGRLDLSYFLAMWEPDLNNAMLPMAMTDTDGFAYPVSSLF